ncbi:ion channel [Dankookia sp. GCM10030260]|uniref:ion channel n=1 Tax=Dankookia sp. GCM10030260 TaxID=3273390 RepID=UPI00361CCF7A
MNPVLENWVGALTVIVGTVLVQVNVQAVLLRILAARAPAVADGGLAGRRTLRSLRILSLATVFVLISGHLVQVALWTLLYLALGEFQHIQDAAYFSLASFTTVGAADLELSRSHRVLGALEAGIGMLLFGWSTALLVSLAGRVQAQQADRGE